MLGYAQDAAAVARRKTRGKDRRAEMTLEERYNDVREFWARLPPQERRKLLRVPLRSLLEGTPATGILHESYDVKLAGIYRAAMGSSKEKSGRVLQGRIS